MIFEPIKYEIRLENTLFIWWFLWNDTISYKISQIKYWIKKRMISVAFCCHLQLLFLLVVSIAAGSIPTSMTDLSLNTLAPFLVYFNFFFFGSRNIFDVAKIFHEKLFAVIVYGPAQTPD